MRTTVVVRSKSTVSMFVNSVRNYSTGAQNEDRSYSNFWLCDSCVRGQAWSGSSTLKYGRTSFTRSRWFGPVGDHQFSDRFRVYAVHRVTKDL